MKDIGRDYADRMWELILTDDPSIIARLETLLEGTQDQAVDRYIERSCWAEDLPHFVGHRGTPRERRDALRVAYGASLPKPEPDFSRLTPLENQLFEALFSSFVYIPKRERRTRRVVDEAMDAALAKARES